MSTLPMAPLAAAWLLTRLRLRRQLNFIGSTFQRKSKGADGKRVGSAPKAGKGLLIAFGLTLVMLPSIAIQARQAALNFACPQLMGCQIGKVDAAMTHKLVSLLYHPVDLASVMTGFSLLMALLVAVCTLIPLGNTELTADWDLEWLATLPIGRAVLLGARVFERSVVNSVALLTIWPALSVLAWFAGWRYWAPLVAFGPTCMMLLLIGAGRALGDTGLRMLLPPARLRNMQALLSIAGMPPMLLVIMFGMPKPMPAADDILGAVPAWFVDTPFGMAVQSVYRHDPGSALAAFAMGMAMSLALAALTILLLVLMLRKGINAGGAREAVRKPAGAANPARRDRRFGSAVAWREITLLGRDRNYLVQTLVLPALIIVTQLFINGGGQDSSALAANASFVGTMAFGLAAYLLMQSAFQTLNTEGAALWMLYTVPRPLVTILRDKIAFWSVLACLYALPVFGLAIWLTGRVTLELAGMAGLVLLGLPIYAAIAGALGIYGCDPLAEDRRHRVRPTFVWLYLLLTGFYSYALFTPDPWKKLVLLIFSAALAVSLWQKAQDRLPYLLDPAASPPSRVSTADGMIGAMMFLVLQGLIGLLIMNVTKAAQLDWATVAMSFGAAGAITVASMLLVFGRSTAGVPAFRPARPLYSAGLGAALGSCALALALLYLWIVKPTVPPTLAGNVVWFALLAVVLAPLAEEFIFRGLLYGGLRRSYPEWVSVVASSALFGAVHPAASFVPVFGLGVVCALAYRKTGALMAPIVAHAMYNGMLVVLSRFVT